MGGEMTKKKGVDGRKRLIYFGLIALLAVIGYMLLGNFYSADAFSNKKVCTESAPKEISKGDLVVRIYDARTKKLMTEDEFYKNFNSKLKTGTFYQKFQGKTCTSGGCATSNRESIEYITTPEIHMYVSLYEIENTCSIKSIQTKKKYYFIGLKQGSDILKNANAKETYLTKNITTFYSWQKDNKTKSIKASKSVKWPASTNNIDKAKKSFDSLIGKPIILKINPEKVL